MNRHDFVILRRREGGGEGEEGGHGAVILERRKEQRKEERSHAGRQVRGRITKSVKDVFSIDVFLKREGRKKGRRRRRRRGVKWSSYTSKEGHV